MRTLAFDMFGGGGEAATHETHEAATVKRMRSFMGSPFI
jgi:hypothetical protein